MTAAEVVERAETSQGELVLRRCGEHFELILNGCFLMDTRDGRSERLMVREAVGERREVQLLLGGLGVGFSLDEALSMRRVRSVTVVELHREVVDWYLRYFTARSAKALADHRAQIHVGDMSTYLADRGDVFDVLCLDVDNGPGWLTSAANATLYQSDGLAQLGRSLAPQGTLAIWSSADDSDFESRLIDQFGHFRKIEVPVARGNPDVVYLTKRR